MERLSTLLHLIVAGEALDDALQYSATAPPSITVLLLGPVAIAKAPGNVKIEKNVTLILILFIISA